MNIVRIVFTYPVAVLLAFVGLNDGASCFATEAAVASHRCPTAKDAQNGIILTREDPFFSIFYKPTPKGFAEQRILINSGKLEPVSSIYYHPLLVGERIGPNETLDLTYAGSVAELVTLPSHGRWKSEVTLYYNHQKMNDGIETLDFRGVAQESVGECSYSVWVVQDRLELANQQPIIFQKYYSPELSVVLRADRLDVSEKVTSEVRYDVIDIGESY